MAEMTGPPNNDVAHVREAIFVAEHSGRGWGGAAEANAALDRLVAALQTARQERDEAQQRVRELEADPDRPTVVYAGDELEACEDKLERAEQTNTRLRDALRDLVDAVGDEEAISAATHEAWLHGSNLVAALADTEQETA